MLVTVSADEVAKYGAIAKLWALVEHLARAPHSIPKEARPLWLIWAYDAEVNNGGHLQYFHNRGVKDVLETLKELRHIGADNHAMLLESSWAVVKQAPLSRVGSLVEYSALAQARSFSEDSAYYELPDLCDLVVSHNEALLDELVHVQV